MCACSARELAIAKRRFAENRYKPREAELWAAVCYWQERLDAPCSCA